jgi:membrane-bound serine protease (ClpP class)
MLAAAVPLLRGQDADVVYRVPVTGTVEMGLAPFVARALEEASAAGAVGVVLDIDTPGGRIDAAWEIIDAVRDAGVPVYAYVNRRDLSAGAMIALSAEGLYMRPGSTIGAATPVVGQGEKASEKLVSAMRSEFRALAEERGFDPAIAEAMVDEKVAIEGISEAGRLLTLTTQEAVDLGVAEAEVADWDGLVAAIGASDVPVRAVSPNWAERVVRLLTHPMLAPLLLSLGFMGLIVEIKTPTFGLAGAVGLLCLAAFFGARFVVHLAGMEELILLGVGAGLIGLEVFVIPGFGVAGLAGGVSVLTALTLSMLGSYPTVAEVISALGIIAVSILVIGVVAFAVLRHLPHSRTMSGVLLDRATTQEAGYLSAPDRPDLALVGQGMGRRIGDSANDRGCSLLNFTCIGIAALDICLGNTVGGEQDVGLQVLVDAAKHSLQQVLHRGNVLLIAGVPVDYLHLIAAGLRLKVFDR